MSVRSFATVGVAALVWAVPAAAQQRGTMEFGAFASAASFDQGLSLKNAIGGGGRAGMYLGPSLAIEFEKGEMRAKRPSGLKDVNVGILSSRLVATPVRSGALSLLLGLGAGVSTETNFMHSYGLDALVGAKLGLGESAALRVDGVWDWLANEKKADGSHLTYKTVRFGISFYRNPFHELRTVTVVTPAPPAPPAQIIQREDTESREALRRLRDSLNALPVCMPSRVSSDQVISIRKDGGDSMDAQLHFGCGSSALDGTATAQLDSKIDMVRANSAMTVVVLGYSDASDGYNMSLGTRRAQAAKDYIVAHGIAADRVVIQSGGVAPSGRSTFRLVIVPDVIKQ